MEAIIFTGLQAAGKSSFYKEQFFNTHVRINLDMLRTRHREHLLLHACTEGKQPFVVDNTNATAKGRALYIEAAKHSGFTIVSYYFEPDVAGSRQRNNLRPERERVPVGAIYGTAKRLEPPAWEEGFNAMYTVRIVGSSFVVEEQVRDA